MVWWEKPVLFCVLVIAIGLLGTALIRLLAKRSIANWTGTGVHDGLEPDEAALLLRLHPSAIVLIRCLRLEAAGRLRITSDIPLRVEWTGGRPDGPVEAAFAEALDEEGRFREGPVFEILEAIYERVNSEMVPYGGRATAVHYRQHAARLLEEYLDKGGGDPVAVPWFLLRDLGECWDRIGDDELGVALKRGARLKNRAIDRLVQMASYVARVKGCGDAGFFRWRKDLKALGSRIARGKEVPNWMRAQGPS